MKKLVPLVIGLILSTGTLSLHLVQIVPEPAAAASALLDQHSAFHSGSIAVKRPKTLRKPSTMAPVASVTAPTVKAAQALPPPTDPLAAIDQPGIREHHKNLARSLLSRLPVECQQKLENFYVVYDDPNHRGLAGRGTIIVNGSLSDRAFIGQLLHEGFGHFWDLTCTDGIAQSGNSPFKDGGTPVYNDDPSAKFYAISWESESVRKASTRKADFASGYAFDGDPFEDLAEAVTYYVLQPEAFAARAQSNAAMAQKYAWMQEHFPVRETLAQGSKWTGSVAWDASKVPYTWLDE